MQNTTAAAQFLGNSEAVSSLAVILLVFLFILIVSAILKISFFQFFSKAAEWLLRAAGKMIGRREAKYHRDVAIGKLDEKRRAVKIYRSLNDLTIDLGLKQKGTKPYELLFLVLVFSFLVTVVFCQAIFQSFAMVFVMYGPIAVAIMGALYTRANIAHDSRIEAIIEAENIICNNIKGGVVVAIRDCIEVIPVSVRDSFKEFLDNVDHKNMHAREALMDLNANLGSVADEFIKKCIVFEYEEEHGIAGMFQDIVEINNIKTEMRIEMKRQFEMVMTQFKLGAGIIFAFLGGVLIISPTVRDFYFQHWFGRALLAGDFVLMVFEYVYITRLRAQEL
jgi:hypothetical protein